MKGTQEYAEPSQSILKCSQTSLGNGKNSVGLGHKVYKRVLEGEVCSKIVKGFSLKIEVYGFYLVS